MLNFIINLSYFSILIGMGMAIYKAIKNRQIKKVFLIIFVPFYVFYFILKQEKIATYEKSMAILTIGAFWIFFFAFILKIVFTPPV